MLMFLLLQLKANMYNPPSTATPVVISKQNLYFSYKCIPLILKSDRQYEKSSIDGPKA